MPWRLKGAGRRVYPGFLQLSAFISMNKERHGEAFRKYYAHLAAGELAEAKTIGDFYEEYMAVCRPLGRLLPRDRASSSSRTTRCRSAS